MTTHVLDQLPLWVEGDLNAADLAVVEGHLAECPACHAAAARLRISQTWLREALTPPFPPSNEGAWQREVMAQIRLEAAAKPPRRLAVRRGLLAACAASLLIATLTWRREPKASAQFSRPAAPPVPETVTPQPEARPIRALREAPRLIQPPPPMAPAQQAGSPLPAEPARIEFQAADPSIRIIWLAQAKPPSESNTPILEEP